MKIIVSLFLILVQLSCNSNKKQNIQNDENKAVKTTYKLELVWESDTLLKTPESVLIDRKNNILFVSCVNMNPWEKDGNGFISKLDMNGNIQELKWIEGLNGPKGMGISGNSFFVADINTLVEANLESGEIINTIELEGNPDLNDITVSEDGTVFVSGSGSNTIYKLQNGVLEEIHKGDEGERFNGLLWEKDRMMLLTSASSMFKEIPWESMEAKVISENMGHGDGIVALGDGSYITTSWQGAIFHVSAKGEKTTLLETEALGENAADLDYSKENETLYLPTFFKNQVKAYKLIKGE